MQILLYDVPDIRVGNHQHGYLIIIGADKTKKAYATAARDHGAHPRIIGPWGL